MKRTISNNAIASRSLLCQTYWWTTGEPGSLPGLPEIVGKCVDEGCFFDEESPCPFPCMDKLGQKPDGKCGRFQESVMEDMYFE